MPRPRRLERLMRVAERFHQLGAQSAGAVYPEITVDGRRTWSGVKVYGTADLPDGTILRYEMVAPGRLFGRGRRMGEVRVEGGQYAVNVDPAPWNSPTLEVAISVRADPRQPPATQSLLGSHGERLAGDVSGRGYSEHFITARLDLGER